MLRQQLAAVHFGPQADFTFVPEPLETRYMDWSLPPFGAGEASTAPVAAALANAVFDATGVRLRAVPFTPDRVKAALTAHAGSGAPTPSTPDVGRQ